MTTTGLSTFRIGPNGRPQIVPTVTRPCDAQELKAQIGRWNILAISGGRVVIFPDGIDLPVGAGYRVVIRLAADDTYVVRRVFKRGAQEWVKGEQTNVYCDEIGEVAYRASCFRNGPWGE